MTKHEARQWIRKHFADLIRQSDPVMGDVPAEVGEVWNDEVVKLSNRIHRAKEAQRNE